MDTLSAGGLACVTVPLLVWGEINKVGGVKVTIKIEVTTLDKITLSPQTEGLCKILTEEYPMAGGKYHPKLVLSTSGKKVTSTV